jgi:hypothetical protein
LHGLDSLRIGECCHRGSHDTRHALWYSHR